MNVTDILMNSVYGIGGGGGTPTLQSKTATPTKQSQTVQPDSGYDGLSQVTVEAIPARYPDVSQDTAVESDVAQGKTFHKADGTQATGTASGSAGVDERFVTRPYSASADIELTYDGTSMGSYAMYKYSSLGKINLPNVKSIFANAFESSTIKTVTGCSKLEVISSQSFKSCGSLETIPLDGGKLWKIDTYAFQNCSKFAPGLIKLNTSGKQGAGIMNMAFFMCGSLVANPFTVKIVQEGWGPWNIENGFYSCSKLAQVNINAETNPGISSMTFYDCSSLTDIYVSWAENEVSGAPWGATNATIHYDTVFDANGDPIV